VAVSLDDPGLPARIREGDPEVLQAVVRAYLEQCVRTALGAGLDRQTAEDVAQVTFTTFIERRVDFEGRSHVRTWVFGILYRKIAEARRQRQRDERHDDIDEVVEHRFRPDGSWLRPPRAVDAEVLDGEVRAHLHDCLDKLPDKQRMAFVLKEAEGHASDEICKILDVTRTNLGVLLFRARNRLRECLESRGIDGTG
jgi:RNA polymerase sigma-70 factor (ECF subfamily)